MPEISGWAVGPEQKAGRSRNTSTEGDNIYRLAQESYS